MPKKKSKNLWVPEKVADQFDIAVESLAAYWPDKLETGMVAGAMLWDFLRCDLVKQLTLLSEYRNKPISEAIERARDALGAESMVGGAENIQADELGQAGRADESQEVA